MNTSQFHQSILESVDRNKLDVEFDFDAELWLLDKEFYVWMPTQECYGTRHAISGHHFFLDANGNVLGSVVDEKGLAAVGPSHSNELSYWDQIDSRR